MPNQLENKVFKIIEVVGCSSQSIEDAIQCAINRASETLQHLAWFEVGEIRGYIEDNKLYYEVIIRIGFKVV